MSNWESQTKQIQGELYDYTKCPVCEIWIQPKDKDRHIDSPECARWLKNKAIRQRAEGKALRSL